MDQITISRRPEGVVGKNFSGCLEGAVKDLQEIFLTTSPLSGIVHQGYKMANVGPNAIPTERRMALVEFGDDWKETLQRIRQTVETLAAQRHQAIERVRNQKGREGELLFYFENWPLCFEVAGPTSYMESVTPPVMKMSERGVAVWMTEEEFRTRWSQEALDARMGR